MVQQFWSLIVTLSETIIGYLIPKVSETILLNLWLGTDIALIRQELAAILFCAAKCVLASA